MKLLILLLNIFPIPIIGTNINTQESFFSSLKELKLFKYYFKKSSYDEIEPLEDIPIIPYTSFSVIALEIELLHGKQSALVELDEYISNNCSKIDWESSKFQTFNSPKRKPKLSHQHKLATLFTAGSHLDRFDSKWTTFQFDFISGNVDLNKLKEQLELYLPKRSIKAYDIELSNSEYYFILTGCISKSLEGSQEHTFKGWVNLYFRVPYSQEFFEDTKRGLLVALENLKNRPNQRENKLLKATELEAKIKNLGFNKTSYFDFLVQRPIEIEKATDNSGRPSYNITFEKIYVNSVGKYEKMPNFVFTNNLVIKDKQTRKKPNSVRFGFIELCRKNDIEEVNSLLDEYFENLMPDTTSSKPDTTISKPDTTKSSYRKGTLIVLLALFLCLVITIFSLGYYYRKKVKKFFNRVYKKRQGKKKLK